MDFLLNPAFSIYVALATVLVVWLGIFALLWRLDRQARDLQRRLDAEQPAAAPASPRATLEVRNQSEQRRENKEQRAENKEQNQTLIS